MKTYLEALEVVPNGETAEFIRLDITDMTDAQVAAIRADVVAIMAGKTYQLKKHICGHDEEQTCQMVEVQ